MCLATTGKTYCFLRFLQPLQFSGPLSFCFWDLKLMKSETRNCNSVTDGRAIRIGWIQGSGSVLGLQAICGWRPPSTDTTLTEQESESKRLKTSDALRGLLRDADLASKQLKGETEERKAAYEWAMSYQNSLLSSLGFGLERIKRSALELTEKLNPETWDQVSMESNMQLTWNTCSHVIWKTYWSQYPRVICGPNRGATHPSPIETRRNQIGFEKWNSWTITPNTIFAVWKSTDVLGFE